MGVTVGRGTLAYGFLLSIMLATMFAGRALKDAVAGLGNSHHPAHLRSILAAALDDSSLDLAFRDTEHGGFVDTSGEPLDPDRVGDGRVSTPVERGGEAIAYIVHDASLTGDPELVQAAGQAMLLALESDRLEAELGATIKELHGSRARIAAAGHAERRKIERDLHDGAQQHLFALGMKLELAARDVAERDPELARELSGVGEELTQVLDDLRQLARGVYPSALRDFGLERALSSAAWRSSQPTKFSATAVGRYPPELEAAVYFCCLESLQNIARHAGADAEAEIRLWTANGDLLLRRRGRRRWLPRRVGTRRQRLREHGRSARGLRGNLDGGGTNPRGTTVRGSRAADRLAPRRLAALFGQVQKRGFHPAIDSFPAPELELREDRVDVAFDGSLRDYQGLCDVAVAPALGDQGEDLLLPVGQRLEPSRLALPTHRKQLVDDLRVDYRPPSRNLEQRSAQLCLISDAELLGGTHDRRSRRRREQVRRAHRRAGSG